MKIHIILVILCLGFIQLQSQSLIKHKDSAHNITNTFGSSDQLDRSILSGVNMINSNSSASSATWLGTVNSLWLDPENWQGSVLPEPCGDITISSGNFDPIVNDVIQVNSIKLENESRLVIGTSGILKIVLDNDCDGVGDILDICPNTLEGKNVDANGCSIQQRLDNGETPLFIINSGIASSDLIGKEYGGGYIFYMDTDSTGLIASFRMPDFADRDGYNIWGCSSVSDPRDADAPTEGNSTSVIGHGQQNTDYITEDGCGVENSGGEIYYNAAETCDRLEVVFGGVTYNDWFFPSRDELKEMYNTIGQGATGQNNNIGNFDNLRYICSNSFTGSSQLAWAIEFQNGGGLYLGNKYTNFAVRAIRDF